MPNVYKRKTDSNRGKWSQKDLIAASQLAKTTSLKAAAARFCIPRKTLAYRMKKADYSAPNHMGPSSLFGPSNELRIKNHIKSMQKSGFPMTRTDLRRLAFNFAEELGLKHNFNRDLKMAGYDWLTRFLAKHRDLAVRKAEGVSLARTQGMNKEEVKNYFDLLETILRDNDLFNKPGRLFNVDETGLQLNTRPGKVIAEKGAKAVMSVTSGEKGETISLIACCNAEGVFLPPACIMKGKNMKKEYQDDMPTGSCIFMSEKSAYVNSDIFLQWLKTIFLPRKPEGKIVLILDGHSSHCSSITLLEFCIQHEIILLCLPSHTTHFLQPLDRAVFKSLKTYFYEASNNYIKNNPGRKINRLNFGKLLNYAWGKTATHQLATKAFKATGIYPYDPSQIPEYAYLTSNVDILDGISGENSENFSVSSTGFISEIGRPCLTEKTVEIPPAPSTSNVQIIPSKSSSSKINISKITPTKVLQDILPLPKLQMSKVKRKLHATELTSPKHVEEIKRKKLTRKSQGKSLFKKEDLEEKENVDFSGEESDDFCIYCAEPFKGSRGREKWIECGTCKKWCHMLCAGVSPKTKTFICELCK